MKTESGWTETFLNVHSDNHKAIILNSPFNYIHSKEQYVTNRHAAILIDYPVSNLSHKYLDATVTTYVINFGKGRIISLGI